MERFVEFLINENVVVVARLEAGVLGLQLLMLCLEASQFLIEIVY